MENRKGSGIFLGVVAVATLVVAIIGATFAYFSITAQSDNDAVNLAAYEFNASLSVNPLYPTGSFKGLIPMDPDATVANVSGTNNKNLLYAINEASQKCVDTAGYQVCQVLELTFTNSGSVAMTLNGTLVTTSNEPTTSGRTGATAFTDLKVRTATGTLGEGGAANSLVYDETSNVADEYAVPTTAGGEIAIGDVTIQPNSTAKKYIIVYLDGTNDGNDNGVDQSDQMGATYLGQLVYASSAGNKLTGTFTIGGGQAQS